MRVDSAGGFLSASLHTSRPRMLRLRVLLFWLLVLAVPLQGFAATTRLLCEGAHHSHATGAQGTHGHGHHAEAAAASADAAPSTPDGGAHQCGLCAACCHAIAIGDAYQLVFASPPPQASAPEGSAAVPTRGVRLPEKPPRFA